MSSIANTTILKIFRLTHVYITHINVNQPYTFLSASVFLCMILFPCAKSTGVFFIMDVFKIYCDVRNEFLYLILKIELINKGFVIDCSVDKNNLTSTECQVFG